MQQIATRKSEIAALSIDIGASIPAGNTRNGSQSAGNGDNFKDAFNEHRPAARQSTEAHHNRQESKAATGGRESSSEHLQERRDTEYASQRNQGKGSHSKEKAELEKPPVEDKSDADVSDKTVSQSEAKTKDADNASEPQPAQGESTTGDATTDDEKEMDWVSFVENIKMLNVGQESADADLNESSEDGLTDGHGLIGCFAPLPENSDSEQSLSDEQAGDEELQTHLDQEAVQNDVLIEIPLITEESDAQDVVADAQAVDTLVQVSDSDSNEPELADLVASEVDSEKVAVVADTTVVEIEPATVLQVINQVLANADKQGRDKSDKHIDLTAKPEPVKAPGQLSEQQLQQILDSLGQTLDKLAGDAEQPNLQAIAAQLNAADKSSSRDFILALKAGIEEFKQQLKQGHQPGMDLSALAAELTGKGVSENINGEQLRSAMAQLLTVADQAVRSHASADFASSLAASAERAQGNVSGQTAAEQSRAAAQSQLNHDKAINILKPEGHQQLAERVRWLVGQNNLQADIRLDPPELGGVKVRINMTGDSASVSFVVQTPQARDALDQAVPRLKELLQEQGIQLGQSSVQQEQNNGQGDEEQLAGNGSSGMSGDENAEQDDNVSVTQSTVRNGVLGGIDFFV